jgi:hypothetical protein
VNLVRGFATRKPDCISAASRHSPRGAPAIPLEAHEASRENRSKHFLRPKLSKLWFRNVVLAASGGDTAPKLRLVEPVERSLVALQANVAEQAAEMQSGYCAASAALEIWS